MMKCYKCKEHYDKKDLRPLGFGNFECRNCSKEFNSKKAKPIEKKWWYFLLGSVMLFALVAIVSGDNNYTSDTYLYAPQNYSLNYSYSNTTYFFNTYCMLNQSLLNYSSERCDVTRSLSYGETYARDDQYCKLNVNCPDTPDCDEILNQTYNVHWRIYRQNDTIYVYNEVKNQTRMYPVDEYFDYEIQVPLSCPTLESWEDDFDQRLEDWKPLNLTGDQWYWMCLEPFGSYATHLTGLANISVTIQKEWMLKFSEVTASNTVLANENGVLKQQNTDYNNMRRDFSL